MSKTYRWYTAHSGNLCIGENGGLTVKISKDDKPIAEYTVPDDMEHTKKNGTEVFRALAFPAHEELQKWGGLKSGTFADVWHDPMNDCTYLLHGHEYTDFSVIVPMADFLNWGYER